jgi:ArsR family metal-binding transcriptional regulator
MTEIEKITHFLLDLKFHQDYRYENEIIWISYHRGETIVMDTNAGTVTVEEPFMEDEIFETLGELECRL